MPAVKIIAFYIARTATLASAFASSPYARNYSDCAYILSNTPAIFCPYIIVRKYESFLINRTVGASCQNFRVLHRAARHALLVQAIKISAFAFYRRVNALFVYKKNITLIFGALRL